jgi:coenzyme F420 hydrogenase subunit beta
MKGYRIRDLMNGIDEPAGKTWFWELEAAVLNTDRCVQCGTCVAVCPSNSLAVSVTTNLPELVKMCTGCSLCWDFCPRAGLRYEATWQGGAEANEPPASPAAGAEDDGLGAVVTKVAVRSRQEEPRAQDGGAVTALLGALLDEGAIDGAIVAAPSSRPDEVLRGRATIATTRDELSAAAGSFYNQTMALASLDLNGRDLPPQPRLALVGTPCEVQGLEAMRRAPWHTGAHQVDAVVLTIALFCTKSFDYDALVHAALREQRGVDLGEVQRVDVTAGRLLVEGREGRVLVDEPIKAFHTAALRGCDECADFLGRSADLAVGSVGSPPGFTSVLARTGAGRAALERAAPALELAALDDLDALRRLDARNRRIAEATLHRSLDAGGALFIDVDAHNEARTGTDRAPVLVAR